MNEKEWQSFSEALSEWQAHPVTELLRDLLGKQLQARKASLQARWWAGQEVSEVDRLAVVRLEEWADDFFLSSAEDIRAAMERDDE